MGLIRVFQRSVRFTFRTKRRFIVFLIIFGIVSTLIAFNIDELDSLQTDELLDQKGIVTEKADGANITYAQTNALHDEIVDKAEELEIPLESSNIFLYLDISDYLKVHSIEIDNPWVNDFATPSFILSGRYPEAVNEIIVPEDSYQTLNVSANGEIVSLQTELTVGQRITLIGNNNDEIELEVVGTFDGSQHEIVSSGGGDDLWLFMDQSMFEDVISIFGFSLEDSLGYRTTYIVDGLILDPETYDLVQTLNENIKPFLQGNEVTYGDWRDTSPRLPLETTKTNSQQILINLGFAAIGGIILSILFAYLLSRFRRREIAILKAMGYGHSAVRAALYGELMTIAFLGFGFGLGVAQGLLLGNDWDFNALIRWQAVLASFVIIVLISLPGMFLVSRRILGVSPAEAFRDK